MTEFAKMTIQESATMNASGEIANAQEVQANKELSHTPTLFAEPVFHVGSFTVTNALLNSWIVVFAIVIVSFFIRRKISIIPKGLQNFFEIVLEGALNMVDSVTGAREKTMRFMPVVLPLFIFILFNNWLGIFPGVGSIGFIEQGEGHRVFVPLFRGATADLNTTLALALMAVVLSHIFGVVSTSAWSHFNKFINVKLFLELPKKIFKEKEYTAIFTNPIQFFVGIIELVGEFSKVASLSFRLFGNIFAGEVLLGAMAAIFAYVVPIPFMFFEIIVGIVQALIFAMLTLVFLTVMSTKHDGHEAH